MQKKYFNTLIIEDDPFSSNMTAMLLAKDFRTHVIGELPTRINLSVFDTLANLRKAKKIQKEQLEFEYFNITLGLPIDVVILDTEVPWDKDLPIKVLEKLSTWSTPPKVLLTCTYPDPNMLEKVSSYGCFSGYVVKSEVLYCIASAVCLAANGYIVITPQICTHLEAGKFEKFPGKILVLSLPSEKKTRSNGKLGLNIIRLKLIFNLPQSEIKEELFTTEEYVSQVIHNKYSDLHMSEIVSEDRVLEDLFSNPYIDNKKIIEYYQKLIPEVLAKRADKKRNSKFRNMDTLAFHLMTRPHIEKW